MATLAAAGPASAANVSANVFATPEAQALYLGYSAAPGERNTLVMRRSALLGDAVRTILFEDRVTIQPDPANLLETIKHCPVIAGGIAACLPMLSDAGLTTDASVTIRLGDRGDTLDVRSGPPGYQDTSIYAGEGDDTVLGGDRSDSIDADPGADLLVGRGGRDHMSYSSYEVPVFVTLDGVANDGSAGEGDNLRTIENVLGSRTAPNVLIGGPGDDTFWGGVAADTIEGGPGADVFNGQAGDDLIRARDGVRDWVNCDQGFDTVIADPLDQISGHCEDVLVG